VALTLELALEDDEDGPAEVEVEVTAEDCKDDDELLIPDEVEETEVLTTLAPQTEGTFAAGPTLDLR
jgi:hypothetical protein